LRPVNVARAMSMPSKAMAVPKATSGIIGLGGGGGDSIAVAVPVIVFTVGVTLEDLGLVVPIIVFTTGVTVEDGGLVVPVMVFTVGMTIEDEGLGVLLEGDTVEAEGVVKDVAGLTSDDGG
jgi:hypothetical protein